MIIRDLRYGVKSKEVNVYDSPGFQDSNSSDVQQNYRNIVKQLESDIHVFLFMAGLTDRMSEDKQEMLEYFHIWTKGFDENYTLQSHAKS